MFRDIIALIQLIRDLLKNRREIEKNFIEDFADPVFSLYKVVHDDYLQTFRKYYDQIESNNLLNLTSTINEIKQDSLFSQDLIAELMAITSIEDELLGGLLESICSYLKSPNILLHSTIQPWSNVKRQSLIELLDWIDKATPEMLLNTGLFDDIQKTSLTLRDSISSIEAARRFSHLDLSSDQDDLNQVVNAISTIKQFLALQCLGFVIEETQKNNINVVHKY